MAGRNQRPRRADDFQGFHHGPQPILNRGPGPLPIHPAALEEEIELQHRENQKIHSENRHLVDENVILERELVAAQDEIHRLGQLMMKIRAEKGARVSELTERGLKLEADLRATDSLREEIIQLRAEARKLNTLRQDLTVDIQSLTQDITRLRTENKQMSTIRTDIDRMRKELTEARRTLEYEKKSNEEHLQQREAMERNLISMAREIEKLRAEQLGVDRRAHTLGGAGAYGMYNRSPERRYGGAWPGHY